MQVNMNYYSAIGAIASKNKTNFKLNPFARSGQTLEVLKDGQAVKLTISDEVVDLSSKIMELSDFLYTHEVDENDIFSYKPKHQWAIFSQFLYDNGAFDGKSNEEIQQMETALQKITAGLDSLSTVGTVGAGSVELDSHEAQLELGASIAALQLFGDKFLTSQTKDGFNQLIQQYKKHNEPIVANHQSIHEKFFAARAKISGVNVNLTAAQAKELAITNAYGKSQQTYEAKLQQVGIYKSLLTSIEKIEDIVPTLEQAKLLLLDFALEKMNKADKEITQGWLENRVQDTFTRIEDYFSYLIEI